MSARMYMRMAMIWDSTLIHGSHEERWQLVRIFRCSCILKRKVSLLDAPTWKLSCHDVDPTQLMELLISLPYRTQSYPESITHHLHVIGDRSTSACSRLSRKTFGF